MDALQAHEEITWAVMRVANEPTCTECGHIEFNGLCPQFVLIPVCLCCFIAKELFVVLTGLSVICSSSDFEVL